MAGQSNRDRGKEQFWRRTLRQWRRSGLSVRAYCAEHGLAEPSFYAWRRIVAERDQESARVRAKPAGGGVRREAPAGSDAPVFVPLLDELVKRLLSRRVRSKRGDLLLGRSTALGIGVPASTLQTWDIFLKNSGDHWVCR